MNTQENKALVVWRSWWRMLPIATVAWLIFTLWQASEQGASIGHTVLFFIVGYIPAIIVCRGLILVMTEFILL